MAEVEIAARVGGLRVSRGLALWALGFALLLVMALFAGLFDRFPGDEWLSHRVQSIPHVGWLARFVNWFDYPWPATIVSTAAGAILFVRRQWMGVALIALSGVARLSHLVAREMVRRPRPSAALTRVTERVNEFGFPSGHVVGAVVFFGAVFYLAPRFSRDWRLQWVVRVLCGVMVVLAGFGRVYTGAHWPSDVVGGYLYGALFLAAIIALDRWVRRGPSAES